MKRRKSVPQKVREMRTILGGRSAVVSKMGAASTSSLKRWERRQCYPLQAHVLLVNVTYSQVKRDQAAIRKMARRMAKEMVAREMYKKNKKTNRRK